MFTKSFDDYVCEGDSIVCEVDGLTITARIVRDDCSDSPDERDDGFWPTLNPNHAGFIGAGKNMADLIPQRKRAEEILQAWKNDEWFYCGIVLSVSKNGVLLDKHAASLWGIECNYPADPATPECKPNAYLMEVAKELLPETIETAQAALKKLCPQETLLAAAQAVIKASLADIFVDVKICPEMAAQLEAFNDALAALAAAINQVS